MKLEMNKINWINFFFLFLSPVMAIGGLWVIISAGGADLRTWIFSGIYLVTTALGVTAGYHRLFAHRSFEASALVRFFLLAFGASCIEHSAKKWCSDHRRHHDFVDQDLDPYNIQKGFFWAHMGWVFHKDEVEFHFKNVPDLKKDKLIEFQHDHYLSFAIGFGFLFPTLMGALWGDAFAGLIIGGFLRVVVNHQFTFFVNSLAHTLGGQNYSLKNSSRDNWLVALLTYGEGYHNFHHAFQGDYRNGIKPWHWDPTKWFIMGLSYLGLTQKLSKTPESKIIKARMIVEEEKFMLKPHPGFTEQAYLSARAQVEESLHKWETLKQEYYTLKTELKTATDQRVALLKKEMHQAKQEFKLNWTIWKSQLKAQRSLA